MSQARIGAATVTGVIPLGQWILAKKTVIATAEPDVRASVKRTPCVGRCRRKPFTLFLEFA
jgi:hypothetical protein